MHEEGNQRRRRPALRWVLLLMVLLVAGGTAGVAWRWSRDPMLVVRHAPKVFERRSGALSANVCGTAFSHAALRYRLNGGDWVGVVQRGPRVRKPAFTIELLPEVLRAGPNELDIEASAFLRPTAKAHLSFEHDTAPIELPRTVDWSGELDVQDGRWEVVQDGVERRVRPVPGAEGYDRIVMASGAFAGGRRVEVEAVVRGFTPGATWAGFGVLTLWGGHPDQRRVFPRRGWLYAIAWYMKPYGPWCEFSVKRGAAARRDVFCGLNEPDPEPGSRYRIVAECWPRQGQGGTFAGYRQRMKLWRAGEPEPATWLSCRDRAPAVLPEREYGVALIAHECQVEFGPVRITPCAGGAGAPPRPR